MNPESNSNIQRTQSGKSSSYKRAHRAARPTLVTEKESEASTSSPSLAVEEEQSTAQVAVEEKPTNRSEGATKRGPRFFSSDSCSPDTGVARQRSRGSQRTGACQGKENCQPDQGQRVRTHAA